MLTLNLIAEKIGAAPTTIQDGYRQMAQFAVSAGPACWAAAGLLGPGGGQARPAFPGPDRHVRGRSGEGERAGPACLQDRIVPPEFADKSVISRLNGSIAPADAKPKAPAVAPPAQQLRSLAAAAAAGPSGPPVVLGSSSSPIVLE